MDIASAAQLISTILYQKRFFPFYTFNLVAGIDEQGQGHVYGYDAVGCINEERFVVQGSAQELVVAALDNQLVGFADF